MHFTVKLYCVSSGKEECQQLFKIPLCDNIIYYANFDIQELPLWSAVCISINSDAKNAGTGEDVDEFLDPLSSYVHIYALPVPIPVTILLERAVKRAV